jgi:predicted Ser/Thr protein kinase
VHSGEFPDDLLEDFAPLRLLGQGGMGAVYLATEVGLDRPVAIKFMRGDLDEDRIARFLREARTLARVEHPNVVRVYSSGTSSRGPYMALEYLEGRALHEVEHPLPVVDLMLQVADGLEAVHKAALVHRDVKPANIVLGADERPVLVDFGLARAQDDEVLTRTGAVVGTVGFLAPELLCGGEAGPAADFYAWGVSLFALLEGRMPFLAADLIANAQGKPLPSPAFHHLPPDGALATTLRACLTPAPERRPTTRAEIEDLLASTGSGPAARLVGDVPRSSTITLGADVLEAMGLGGPRSEEARTDRIAPPAGGAPAPSRSQRRSRVWWSLPIGLTLLLGGLLLWQDAGRPEESVEDVIRARMAADRRAAHDRLVEGFSMYPELLEAYRPMAQDHLLPPPPATEELKGERGLSTSTVGAASPTVFRPLVDLTRRCLRNLEAWEGSGHVLVGDGPEPAAARRLLLENLGGLLTMTAGYPVGLDAQVFAMGEPDEPTRILSGLLPAVHGWVDRALAEGPPPRNPAEARALLAALHGWAFPLPRFGLRPSGWVSQERWEIVEGILEGILEVPGLGSPEGAQPSTLQVLASETRVPLRMALEIRLPEREFQAWLGRYLGEVSRQASSLPPDSRLRVRVALLRALVVADTFAAEREGGITAAATPLVDQIRGDRGSFAGYEDVLELACEEVDKRMANALLRELCR